MELDQYLVFLAESQRLHLRTVDQFIQNMHLLLEEALAQERNAVQGLFDQMNGQGNVQIEQIVNEQDPPVLAEPQVDPPNVIEPIVLDGEQQVVTLYQCSDCGRQFQQKSALKKHNRLHSNVVATGRVKRSSARLSKRTRSKITRRKRQTDKPFHCKWLHCRMSSQYRRNVMRHIRKVHLKSPNGENQNRELISRYFGHSSTASK